MKHLLNNLSEEEKNSIREQHTGGMKVFNENFNNLVESKLGNVKPFISEQMSYSCKDLVSIPKEGTKSLQGAISQGYKGEQGWESKIEKVVSHSKLFQFNGHPSDALKLVSKCNPSKISVDFVEFSKDGKYITYVGVD